MMQLFEQHHISFVSVTQQFNTTHSMGRLTLNILLSFAQFEREIISERTRDKIAAARRKGKWLGGMPLLGYDVEPQGGKLAVNAQEADRVRQIFELYLDKQSLIQTAAELNRRGWTTKRWKTRPGHERGGRPFDKCNLRSLLTNVAYVGKVRYKDEHHPGEHAGIVEPAIWQNAQELLRSNGRTGGMHIRNKYGALLKGLLFCKPCGVAMGHSYTTKKGNRCYRYYVCYQAQKQGWESCPSKSLPAEQVEQFVVEQIRCIGRDPELLARTLAQLNQKHAEASAAAERELRLLERERQKLAGEVRRAQQTAGRSPEDAARLAELEQQLQAADARRHELAGFVERQTRAVNRGELQTALVAFDPLWKTLSPNEQSRVLRLLVQRIDYDGAKGAISITFHPNGIQAIGQKQRKEAVA